MTTESELKELSQQMLKIYGAYMELNIYLDTDDAEFVEKYYEHVKNHNGNLLNNLYLDAGFDILTPIPDNSVTNINSKLLKIDNKLICSAKCVFAGDNITNNETNTQIIIRKFNCGFYLYPRSSIVKTQLRLANGTGIIDAGYRGHLISVFDVIENNLEDKPVIKQFDKYVQICAPNLKPIIVKIVSENEIDFNTNRGTGGFGSTS